MPRIAMSAGIVLSSADRFKIEENDFKTYGVGSFSNFGILSASSGPTSGLIYRNNFNDLVLATYFLGNNPAIRVDCNKFFQTGNDIVVNYGGQLGTQGGCTSSVPPAHNDFHNPCGSFQILHDIAPPPSLSYITELGYQPIFSCYTTSEVSVSTCLYGVTTNSCLSTLGNTSVIQKKMAQVQQEVNKLNVKVDLELSANTLEQIKRYISDESKLKKVLFSKKYLSDDAILTLIQHKPKIPVSVLYELLISNAPLSDMVQSSLWNNYPSLSESFIHKLVVAQGRSNERQQVINNLKTHLQELERQRTDLITAYLEDEKFEEANLLISQDKTGAYNRLEWLYGSAFNLQYQALHESYLSGDTTQLNSLRSFYALVLKYQEAHLGLSSLTEEDKNELALLSDQSSEVGVKAKNILNWIQNKPKELTFHRLPNDKTDYKLIASLTEKVGLPLNPEKKSYTIKMYSPVLKTEILSFIRDKVFSHPINTDSVNLEKGVAVWTNLLTKSVNLTLEPGRLRNMTLEMARYKTHAFQLKEYLAAVYDGIWKNDLSSNAKTSTFRLNLHEIYIRRMLELMRSERNPVVQRELSYEIEKLKRDLKTAIEEKPDNPNKSEYDKYLKML